MVRQAHPERVEGLRDLRGSTGSPRPEPVEGRASAVQIPSPCTEIALARLATQKPEYPKKDSRRSELIAIAETHRMNHGSSRTIRPRSGRRLPAIIVWKRKPDPKAPDRIFSARNEI